MVMIGAFSRMVRKFAVACRDGEDVKDAGARAGVLTVGVALVFAGLPLVESGSYVVGGGLVGAGALLLALREVDEITDDL